MFVGTGDGLLTVADDIVIRIVGTIGGANDTDFSSTLGNALVIQKQLVLIGRLRLKPTGILELKVVD